MSNSSHAQSCFFIKFKEAFLKASLHLTVSNQEHIVARCFNANNYLSFYNKLMVLPSFEWISGAYCKWWTVFKSYTKAVVISIQYIYIYIYIYIRRKKSRNYFLTAPLIRRTKNLCYIKLGFEFRLDIHVQNAVLGKDIWIGTYVGFTWCILESQYLVHHEAWNRLYPALEMRVRLFYRAEVMSLLLWHSGCLWLRSHREQNVVYIGSNVNTNVTHISGVVISLSAYTHIADRYVLFFAVMRVWDCTDKVQVIHFLVHSTRFSMGTSNISSGSTAGWGTAPQDGSFRVRFPVGIHSFCPHSVSRRPRSLQQKCVPRNFLGV